MTNQQIEDLTKEIGSSISAGIDIASVFVPGGAAYFIIGKAVTAAVPELGKIVARWLDGNPPTQDELDEFKRQLSVLTDPNAP